MPIDTADHLELLNLYARYSFAFDTGDQGASKPRTFRPWASMDNPGALLVLPLT